jgi:hypothetical protein
MVLVMYATIYARSVQTALAVFVVPDGWGGAKIKGEPTVVRRYLGALQDLKYHGFNWGWRVRSTASPFLF